MSLNRGVCPFKEPSPSEGITPIFIRPPVAPCVMIASDLPATIATGIVEYLPLPLQKGRGFKRWRSAPLFVATASLQGHGDTAESPFLIRKGKPGVRFAAVGSDRRR